MSKAINWEKLEEKFYGELEENKEAIIKELEEPLEAAMTAGGDTYRDFANDAKDKLGGLLIPHLFWAELKIFVEEPEHRPHIFEMIQAFTVSNFEEEEMKKIKPLLITYFSIEKEFEINKIQNLIVDKAHPGVQDYFGKLISFVKKNQSSVKMYIEKFDMLKDKSPDFELLRLPVIKLKERLVNA